MDLRVSPPYRFASHVYACREGADLVLLDLKRDRYLGMDARDAQALCSQIAGLPGSPGDLAAADTGVLGELLDLGMLAHSTTNDAVSGVASIERPERALIEGYVEIRSTIRFRDVMSVLIAVLTAAVLTRFCSLERIVQHLARSRRAASRADFDVERARHRLAVFDRLRALIYSEGQACLFSSLAIRDYLARDGLFPRLVFGIATRPFRAHCWLQHGDIVINDTPEYVREHTPILVV